MRLWDKDAGNVDGEHFVEDLVLATHDVERKADEYEEEWEFDNKIPYKKPSCSTYDGQAIPNRVQVNCPNISYDRQ